MRRSQRTALLSLWPLIPLRVVWFLDAGPGMMGRCRIATWSHTSKPSWGPPARCWVRNSSGRTRPGRWLWTQRHRHRSALPQPLERGCKAGVDRPIAAQRPAVSGPGFGAGGLHRGYSALGHREAGLRARAERRPRHGLPADLSTCGPSGGRRDVLVRTGPQHPAPKRPGVGGAAGLGGFRRTTTGRVAEPTDRLAALVDGAVRPIRRPICSRRRRRGPGGLPRAGPIPLRKVAFQSRRRPSDTRGRLPAGRGDRAVHRSTLRWACTLGPASTDLPGRRSARAPD